MKVVIESLREDGSNTTILLAKHGEKNVGVIAYLESEGKLPYAFDLVCKEEFPEVASKLIQRVRKECKLKGYDRVEFDIRPANPGLLQMVLSGAFRVEKIIASCPT